MPTPPTVDVHGVTVPTLIYGTAWKEEATAELVRTALAEGFRGLDTANQRKHYHEVGVGEGLRAAREAGLAREDVFLQTKFTFRAGQDHRLPYDPEAPVEDQVAQSLTSSLEHLGVDHVDSLVLHGPSQRSGLGDADRAAWRAMEAAKRDGRTRAIGVSNVQPDQLAALIDLAEEPVAFVQNRCFARTGWDARTRLVCDRNGVAYQGFSLLTANPDVLRHPRLAAIAERHGATRPQVIFRFAREIGMLALTGTTDPTHMRRDLDLADLDLDEEEIEAIARMGLGR